MRLDDEVRPARTGFLVLALVGAIVFYVLMAGARLPGSAFSYIGGAPNAIPYTMVSSWTPTLAAGSDEFTTDTSANWTLQAAGGTGTTSINLLATPSLSLFNFATRIPGWLVMQAESATGIAAASKAYTLPTSIAIYSRITPGKRGPVNDGSVTADDGRIAVIFSATSSSQVDLSNFVECAIQKVPSAASTRNYAVAKVQAGALTETAGDRVTDTMPNGFDTVLFQKRSSTYHCWVCRSMSGTCGWVGSVTWGGAATLDRVGILAQNTTTTAPAPLSHRLDYFRIVEADNVLP